jgi:hypothetical protein
MANFSIADAQAVLKTLYPEKVIDQMLDQSDPLVAALAKNTNFFGDGKYVSTIYEGPNGVGSSLGNAITNKNNSTGFKSARFNLTRESYFGVQSIDNEAVEASASDKGALVNLMKKHGNLLLKKLMGAFCAQLYGAGTGSIGKVGSFTGATITLDDTAGVSKFGVGTTIQLAATDGGAPRTGTLVITGINRDTGVLTFGGNVTAGIAAAAQGDFIYRNGDQAAVFTGLAGWIPYTTPTSTPFFGVDRTADVVRLGGIRMDVSDRSIEEGLQDVAARLSREGASPDICVVSYETWQEFAKELGDRKKQDKIELGTAGYDALMVAGPSGRIPVVPSRFVDKDYGYMLTTSTWEWHGLGKLPRVWNDDGNEWLRLAGEDAVELRAIYRGQLSCEAPGYNAVFKIR